MLKTYWRLALRHLGKHKGYTVINLFGLGIGLAAALIIGLYARHELTYDRFHERSDRIYQVYKERITPAGVQVTRDTWVPLGEALERDFPAVEESVRLFTTDFWVEHGARRYEEDVTLTDATLFTVFDFALQRGDAATALDVPSSVVVSEAIARKYFGDRDPIGQTLTLDDELSYTVTGILAPIPSNSTIQIDLAIPFVSLPQYERMKTNWGGSFLDTFVLLAPAAAAGALEAQFPAFITRTWDAETAGRTNFKLERLADLHDAIAGNRRYAYILLGLAAAILLIAIINFANLATARAGDRAREIGMRKVLGAERRQLAGQFLGEAWLLVGLALVVALALAQLTLPVFNALYGVELALPFAEPLALGALLGGALGVGLLAGAYPAFVLSGFAPIQSLQGLAASGRQGGALRRGLVVVQFALSIALIAGTLGVLRQVDFMKEAELGLDRTHVVAVAVEAADFPDAEAANERLQTFKARLRQEAGVASVASTSHLPGGWEGWFTFARPEGWGDQDPLRVRMAYMDAGYFQTFGVPFVEGRDFDEGRGTDAEGAVIVNRAALEAFGWSSGVGRTVRRGDTDFEIVGVVEDYHFDGLQSEIAPVLHFFRPPENGVHNYVAVRMKPGPVEAQRAALEAAWDVVDASRPAPYLFLDDRFRQLYQAEERLAAAAGAFALVAVLVACLGLFGLAALVTRQRTKEIGIRKTLGASTPGLVGMLTGRFARLVGLGFVLAVPLAWVGLDRWLAGFAYRVEIDAGIFLAAGLVALGVALATVGYHALRAALADPVDALRYE